MSPKRKDELLGSIGRIALNPNDYKELVDTWVQTLDCPERVLETLHRCDSFLLFLERASMMSELAGDSEGGKWASLLRDISDSAVLFGPRGNPLASNRRSYRVEAESTAEACRYLGITAQELGQFSSKVRDSDNMRRLLSLETPDGPQYYFAKAVYDGHERCLLIQRIDLTVSTSVVAQISDCFDLTEAESDILTGILSGMSRTTIARQRAVSPETIKRQTSEIIRKTNASNRYDLIRLSSVLAKLSDYRAVTDAVVANQDLPVYSRGTAKYQVLASRTDDRTIEYHVIGALQGPTIVLTHGTYGICRLTPEMEADIAKRGYRMIVVMRPGYGRTSPIATKDRLLKTIRGDVMEVLDNEKVGDAIVLTQENDSFIGFHLCACDPDRFKGLIAAAGVLPLIRDEMFVDMDKWNRSVIETARKYPATLAFLVKAGFRFARVIGKRNFLHEAYGSSAADRALVANDKIFETFKAASEIALNRQHSVHQAYAREMTEFASCKWRSDVVRCQTVVPVSIISGLEDPVLSDTTLSLFQEEYSWIDFNLLSNAGQFVLFQEWWFVLKKIDAFFRRSEIISHS